MQASNAPLSFRRTKPRASRGFTLIELMVTVAIMGIMGAIVSRSFMKDLDRAKNNEAKTMVASIAVAQEKFKTHHPTYLDVSGSITNWYPAATVGRIKRNFWGWPNDANWVRLDPKVPQYVHYVYATTAGLPYTAPSNVSDIDALDGSTDFPAWPATSTIHEPWYIVAAQGDVNGNGVVNTMLLSSFTDGKIWIENSGE